MGCPNYIQCYFFVGSSAHWTLRNMTIFTLCKCSYNNVIESFTSIASGGTILESKLTIYIIYRTFFPLSTSVFYILKNHKKQILAIFTDIQKFKSLNS
jgi:hypothetical protein